MSSTSSIGCQGYCFKIKWGFTSLAFITTEVLNSQGFQPALNSTSLCWAGKGKFTWNPRCQGYQNGHLYTKYMEKTCTYVHSMWKKLASERNCVACFTGGLSNLQWCWQRLQMMRYKYIYNYIFILFNELNALMISPSPSHCLTLFTHQIANLNV